MTIKLNVIDHLSPNFYSEIIFFNSSKFSQQTLLGTLMCITEQTFPISQVNDLFAEENFSEHIIVDEYWYFQMKEMKVLQEIEIQRTSLMKLLWTIFFKFCLHKTGKIFWKEILHFANDRFLRILPNVIFCRLRSIP